jgi:hypothetical protein
MKMLVIEDDVKMARFLREEFNESGCIVAAQPSERCSTQTGRWVRR